MKSLPALTVVCLLASVSGSATPQAAQLEPAPRTVLDRYCVTCHNQRTKAGGLTLDALDVAHVAAQPAIWEAVVRKVRTRTMPPPGMPRPDDATYASLTSWLTAELDRAAVPNPGRPLLRRLNQAEYGNVVRDLLSVQVDVKALLPADDSAFGFDNNADLLVVSPSLLDRYLSAADRVSALAVGDHCDRARLLRLLHARRSSQSQQIDGLPLSARSAGSACVTGFRSTAEISSFTWR